MAYVKQTWDTTSIFNPTRMNYMEQGIHDASTVIEANKHGTDIDITSYNSESNLYTFPSDGYVEALGSDTTTGYIRVVVCGSNSVSALAHLYMNITGTYQAQSMFVRKGMRAYVLGNTHTNGRVFFRPITI